MLILNVLQKPLLDYSNQNVLQKVEDSTYQSQRKQLKPLCKGTSCCLLRLVSVLGTKSNLNQLPSLSAMFYHEELFV